MAGRKRKSGKREPNGRPQRDYANQLAHENQCVVIDARRRHLGVTEQQAKDAKSGYSLGVLHIRQVIDDKQLEAANRHVMDYLRLCRLKGWPNPHPKCAAYVEMIAGMSGGYEPDAETVRAALDRWNESVEAIVDSLGIRASLPAIHALKMFGLYQAHPDLCTPAREVSLVNGCNALVKHYGV